LAALILNCRERIKKLRTLAQDPSVDLWALDEVHFQQHGSRCRMWVPAEVKDPILVHAPTRKSMGYFGAVRLRDGKLLTKREEKVFDAGTFWQFLKLLRQVSSRSARRVVVISDNAKYHHALLSTSCLPIVRNSIRLKGFGNSHGAFVYTMFSSPISTKLLIA
jgi:hypothetical protein